MVALGGSVEKEKYHPNGWYFLYGDPWENSRKPRYARLAPQVCFSASLQIKRCRTAAEGGGVASVKQVHKKTLNRASFFLVKRSIRCPNYLPYIQFHQVGEYYGSLSENKVLLSAIKFVFYLY